MKNHDTDQARIPRFILGGREVILENKIFNMASFILAGLTILLAVVAFSFSRNYTLNLPLILAALIFIVFFYNSRFKEHFKTASVFFIVFSLLFSDYVWFYGAYINRAVDFLFLLILILNLTILPVKWHIFFTAISIANVLAVDWLALHYPRLIYRLPAGYPVEEIIKSHGYLILFFVLVALVLAYFKWNYEQERLLSQEKNRQQANANQALKHRNEHLESLARMVSHNLRSPVAGMKMLLSLYDRMETPEQKEEIVEHLRGGALQLFDMVEDLSVIMLDYKELNKEKEAVSLNEVARSVLTQLAGQIQSQKASVKTDFRQCPQVMYSKTYLDSIFLNLISNALKYCSPDRPADILIKSYKKDNRVMLEFRDNGLGIDLEAHGEQLFKMYKTFHGGLGEDSKGIGLFITKNQVEMMGGKITVESTVNRGTTFYIELYRI